MRLAAAAMVLFLLTGAAVSAAAPPTGTILNNKTSILWIELGANLSTLSDPQKIRELIQKIKNAGFSSIAIEAINSAGYAAYPSEFAPHISKMRVARESIFAPYPAPNSWVVADTDILQELIAAARAERIKVIAAVNIFSKGINIQGFGAAYDALSPECFPTRQAECDSALRAEWLSTYYAASRSIVASTGEEFPIFSVNIGRTIFGVATGRIPNKIVLYTREPPAIPKWATDWAADGIEVIVKVDRKDNFFIDRIVDWQELAGRPYDLSVPSSGFILSAHGEAKRWLLNNFKEGDTLTLSPLRKGLVRSTESGLFAFLNPLNRNVQEYALAILEEIARKYAVDAIVMDRIRYAGTLSDFSPSSRLAFEAYIGRKIVRWPQDIFDYGQTRDWYAPIPGRLFAKWVEFRATAIRKFVQEAVRRVKAIRPNLPIGIYAGAWYPVYYEEATNWASKKYSPPYGWASAKWGEQGIAEYLDFIISGLYYRNLTIEEARNRRPSRDADWASIEGGMELVKTVTKGATIIIGGINITDYEDRPEAVQEALSMIRENLDGVMVFDLVYVEAFDLWDELRAILGRN